MSYKRCNADLYYVWKIHIRIGGPSLQQGVVLKWFYSLRAVGTPLLEVPSILLVIIIIFIINEVHFTQSRMPA